MTRLPLTQTRTPSSARTRKTWLPVQVGFKDPVQRTENVVGTTPVVSMGPWAGHTAAVKLMLGSRREVTNSLKLTLS
jgi:hypothetical protein